MQIGQRVRCIGSQKNSRDWPETVFPTIGEIYTIRDIAPGLGGYHLGKVYLRFYELRNSLCETVDYGPMEPAFNRKWFRPLRETSIEIFTSMLTQPPAKTKRVRA